MSDDDRDTPGAPIAVPRQGSTQRRQGLVGKFRCAFRGVRTALAWESNFRIHLVATAAVAVAGVVLGVSRLEACLLALCVASVLTAETFNCAIEQLAKAISHERRADLGAALDMASGAVLIAAGGAVVVGAVIFVNRCGVLAGWWNG